MTHCHGLIHDAADKGDVEALRRQLALGVPPTADHHGTTPLYYLISGGQYDWNPDDRITCLNALLEAGADIHANVSADAPPPLHWAAANGHVKLVAALLKAGADVLIIGLRPTRTSRK